MSHPKEEKTILIIKPDGVKRGLVGEILKRIEQRGLKIIALQMFKASKKEMDKHYPKDKAWIKRLGEKAMKNYKNRREAKRILNTDDPLEVGKRTRSWLLDYVTSGPIVKVAIKGIHAIDMVRKLIGPTFPSEAEMGTIRGDYSVDSAFAANHDQRAIHNIVHASETKKEVKHELKFWFSSKEIHDYKRAEEEIMF